MVRARCTIPTPTSTTQPSRWPPISRLKNRTKQTGYAMPLRPCRLANGRLSRCSGYRRARWKKLLGGPGTARSPLKSICTVHCVLCATVWGRRGMSEAHAALIGRLTRDLRPVTRLPALWRGFALWLAAVVWIGLLLSPFADFHGLELRLFAAPDMWISLTGAGLTALFASWAALQTSIPGRPASWALLPLPAVVVWVGASAAGCLRLSPIAGVEWEPRMHPMMCLRFIFLVSFPLSALFGWLLLRGYPLRPRLTAALGGLASAAAAAVLLAMVHPFDATIDDLSVHFFAVLCVVGLAQLWGRRALDPRPTFPAQPSAGWS